MDSTTKKIRLIFEQGEVTPADIRYALQLKGLTLAAVAADCKVSRPIVSQVISGDQTSHNVATYISAALGISMPRLWGNKYTFTPRKRRATQSGAEVAHG